MAPETAPPAPRVIADQGLGDLYRVLAAEGYRVIDPAVQDGAIVLRELLSATELPFGWGRPAGARRLLVAPPRRPGRVRSFGGASYSSTHVVLEGPSGDLSTCSR